ncbi:hypothetical protein MARPO_0065s0032 [Marchantia polymorpha]|uniref:Alfin N-terminal domain-containing protein n=1 Tax=Marchantia polymorpha TaxID=3197 RepID=A0A2R6WQT0_MARPO|nr:hypothetical protein MARPO_0065s0032 [Marchantia polymorpha]|eukprot:PTQ36219.1 hypothetical protein MARPO_0065s0032 [Marchantia polymorpha]
MHGCFYVDEWERTSLVESVCLSADKPKNYRPAKVASPIEFLPVFQWRTDTSSDGTEGSGLTVPAAENNHPHNFGRGSDDGLKLRRISGSKTMNQKIQDVLDPKFENVEVIYAAVKRRQAGIIKALTMESDELFRQCDPETDNLCLYGLPDGGWKVALPAQDVPTELPEPALGINFARDGMSRQDWLTLIALHSDAWLLAIASFYGAELTRNERKRLLVMLGDSPTSYDIVTGKNVDDSLDYSRVHHIKAIDACSLPMITGGSKDEIRVKQVITDENDRGRMISNHTFLAPKAVTNPATPHKQWEQVLPAIPRSVENCRNQFAEPAKVVSEAPCVPEMAQSIHMNATAAVDDLSVPQADPEVPEASGSAPRERERPPARWTDWFRFALRVRGFSSFFTESLCRFVVCRTRLG